MNQTAAVTQSPKSLWMRWIPEGIVERTFFWASLPAFMLLFNLTVAIFHPSPLTAPLSCVVLGSLVASVRYRTWGLICSYVALTALVLLFYREIPPTERLWQMGIVFAFAVNAFISLLCFEEIDQLVGGLKEEAHERLQQIRQVELSHGQEQTNWHETREALEEEIRKLKGEAEQRRIERQADQQRYSLVESEIGLLNSQKEEFLNEIRSSRQELQEKVSWVGGELDRLGDTEIAELKREKAKAEGLYHQLRKQFAEKSDLLDAARKELFELQGKVEVSERQNALNDVPPIVEEVRHHESVIAELTEEVERLQGECTALESVVSSLMSNEK